MIRLGLCCIFRDEPIKFRTATAAAVKKLRQRERLAKLADICLSNAHALLDALQYCSGHGIGFFRINSQILPIKTHPQVGYELGDLPGGEQIVDQFRRCGEYARTNGLRTTFHPDQFVVLNSRKPEVVEHSIAELAYQAEERWGRPRTRAGSATRSGSRRRPGLPAAFLERQPHALREVVARYARTHGPFTAVDVARRYATGEAPVLGALAELLKDGRVLEGEFRPGGRHREWCDARVLALVRRRSLARLRRDVEPVEARVLGRLLTVWQGVTRPRRGLDALLDAVEHLQGAPVPASLLESAVLPARIEEYASADLDALVAAGEVVSSKACRPATVFAQLPRPR